LNRRKKIFRRKFNRAKAKGFHINKSVLAQLMSRQWLGARALAVAMMILTINAAMLGQ